MRRLTSVKQYGLIEGALLALAPFALLMAHNKAGQFPALMPPLAAFFTAGCGLAAARLLFLNPRYGKLFGWLFWIGALVGTLPILIGNPFAALLFATFFIISGFALTDFKVDYQELLTTPRAERCRQRAAGAALVLGGAVLVSASLNQPDYLEARMCFILSALASLWLLLRWVRLSQRRHVSWFYSAAAGMLLLPLLVSLVSGRTRAVALFIALLMSIPLYRFRRTAAPREHWWELVLNHPGRTLFSTFLTLCTFGALLLNLSFSTVRPEIPFIDAFEVKVDSPSSLTIRVYEKNIVGYVHYLGKNVYFDKDGIVVESSDQEIEGVPLIKGLTFDRLTMHQALNVKDASIFGTILNITQLLDKYGLKPDEIRFGNNLELYLSMKDVTVNLGTGDHLDEKISRLKKLEPDLEDKSGSLHMENYTDESTHISLEASR